jgi:hypothetical protein
MSDAELRWCGDLLYKRHLKLTQPPPDEPAPVADEPMDIDSADVAVMSTGIRIRIYPGEGAGPESFAGEIINPTDRQMRGQGHVSCLWDRAKVVRLEGLRPARPTP